MRKVVCLFGLLLLIGLPAASQESAPKVEGFLGYSYIRANPQTSGLDSFNLHGGSGSFAYNLNNSLGLVADLGGYHAGNIGGSGVDANFFSYLFGPRLSYRGLSKITPFAQVLFGGTRSSANFFGSSFSQNAFAMTAGGGVDVRAGERFSLRLVQAEYYLTRFPEFPGNNVTQNNLRLSTGVVFRFGK